MVVNNPIYFYDNLQIWFETYFNEEYDRFVEEEDYEERKKDMEDALRTHNQQYFQEEVDDLLVNMNVENEWFRTAIIRTIDYEELIKALITYIYEEHDVAVVEWVKERNE